MLRIQHSHDGETWHVNDVADHATRMLLGRDNLTGWRGMVDVLRQKVVEKRYVLFYRLVDETKRSTRVIH